MLRGQKKFKCDDCGAVFTADDMEWRATCYSVPQPCPECSSKHTYPNSLFPFFSKKEVYRKIWTEMDEE